MQMKITTFSVFACMAFSIACNPNKDADKDRNGLLMLAFVLDAAQINLKLDRQTATSARVSASSLSSLPARFQDGLPTQVIPAKKFSLGVIRIFLWKSQSLGGVENGKETIANADVTILDMGAQGTGPEASGKKSFSVFEGNLLQNSYGYSDGNGNIERQWRVSEQWKDSSFDRIGIEISEISFEFDMTHLTSKSNRIVSLEVKGITKPSNVISESEGYLRTVTVPVSYVLSYPSKHNTSTDTPCSDSNPNFWYPPEFSQALGCRGLGINRFYIDKRTGAPSPGNPFYYRGFAGKLSNVPNFSDSEYEAFYSQALPYPKIPSAVINQFANWETPVNEKVYDQSIWKSERVVLLNLPKGNRKKVNIVLDASQSFVFQTSSEGSKFEMNEVPKLFHPDKNSNDLLSTLDPAWLTTYGNDYSAWSYAPKNGNQPDPANGRDFGYFLPKFSVTAE